MVKKCVVRSSLNHTPHAHWPLVSESKLWYEATTYQYKVIWDEQVGEQLQCRRETSNPHDIYAVAILKSGVVIAEATRLFLQPRALINGCG